MTREIETLQRENNSIKSHEETLRQELLNCEKQRDVFRDKYHDYKARNSMMNTKLSEIESEFNTILIEKEKENMFRMEKKNEDSLKKKEKIDSKQKVNL